MTLEASAYCMASRPTGFRARIILKQGDGRPFRKFDRTAMFDESAGKSLDELLDAFAATREANLATLHTLDITPEKLVLKGTHPSLGAVTLSNLLSTWAIHDLNHLGQIVEVMAHQYEATVRPWKAYLAILNRPELASSLRPGTHHSLMKHQRGGERRDQATWRLLGAGQAALLEVRYGESRTFRIIAYSHVHATSTQDAVRMVYSPHRFIPPPTRCCVAFLGAPLRRGWNRSSLGGHASLPYSRGR